MNILDNISTFKIEIFYEKMCFYLIFNRFQFEKKRDLDEQKIERNNKMMGRETVKDNKIKIYDKLRKKRLYQCGINQ